MRKLNWLRSVGTAVLSASLLSAATASEAQQKSLRQETADTLAQGLAITESRAYCVGYFEISGDAAEVLELKGGYPKDTARNFLRAVEKYGLNFEQTSLGFALQARGDETYVRALQAAGERGVTRGRADSRNPATEAVASRFKSCALQLGFASAEDFADPSPFRLSVSPTSPNLLQANDATRIHDTIAACFRVPSDVAIRIDENFNPSVSHVVEINRYRMEEGYHRLADAIMKSLRDRNCLPWRPLESAKFDYGSMSLILDFDTRDPSRQIPPSSELAIERKPIARPLGQVANGGEVEAIRQILGGCLRGYAGSNKPAVSLVLSLDRDGRPTKAEVRDIQRFKADPAFAAAAEAIRKQILDPRCRPWPLNPEKYHLWQQVTVDLDPRAL